jgi:small subunit ribosomal protein S6
MARITQKFESLISDNAGTILVAEDWGKRKLAYPIRKHGRGHYIYLNYVGPSNIIAEVERNLNNEDDLLRYLTVQLAAAVEPEVQRAMAEERRRLRIERMAALKAEEEAEARYRAEEEADEDVQVEAED